ncbi:MAG TPA: hypothetical protein VGM52_15440 [Herbaspirillum sp.]|jgi:predicted ArsR family transcriptional regulator
MIDMIGARHKEFLELLIRNKAGLTVENFSAGLGITRNAVRQHLATLETHALIAKSVTRPSGGRPEQLYVLTEKGSAYFPRQYSWFAQLLIETVEQEVGEGALGDRLAAMGEKVARNLRAGAPEAESLPVRVQQLAGIMQDMGYKINPDAVPNIKGIPIIEADNCVFHDLAKKQPHVCRFDLALLATFTDSTVVHEECMVKGGNVCRFRFEKESAGNKRRNS